MDLARRSTDQLDTNGSAPIRLAPPPAEPTLRVLHAAEPPPARRPSGTTLAVLGMLAGVGAIALGSAAFVTEALSDEDAPPPVSGVAPGAEERAIALLARPTTERLPLEGSEGRVVLAVGAGGRAVLTLRGLEPAPAGERYQAWLLGPDNRVVGPAGSFTGAETIVPLTRTVGRGSGIGVTLEPEGAQAPTKRIELVAWRD